MMRVSPILLLLAVGLSASGQTITDINVRGQAATKPPVRIVGGSGTGPGDQTTLVAELTVDDPSGLVPGKALNRACPQAGRFGAHSWIEQAAIEHEHQREPDWQGQDRRKFQRQ